MAPYWNQEVTGASLFDEFTKQIQSFKELSTRIRDEIQDKGTSTEMSISQFTGSGTTVLRSLQKCVNDAFHQVVERETDNTLKQDIKANVILSFEELVKITGVLEGLAEGSLWARHRDDDLWEQYGACQKENDRLIEENNRLKSELRKAEASIRMQGQAKACRECERLEGRVSELVKQVETIDVNAEDRIWIAEKELASTSSSLEAAEKENKSLREQVFQLEVALEEEKAQEKIRKASNAAMLDELANAQETQVQDQQQAPKSEEPVEKKPDEEIGNRVIKNLIEPPKSSPGAIRNTTKFLTSEMGSAGTPSPKSPPGHTFASERPSSRDSLYSLSRAGERPWSRDSQHPLSRFVESSTPPGTPTAHGSAVEDDDAALSPGARSGRSTPRPNKTDAGPGDEPPSQETAQPTPANEEAVLFSTVPTKKDESANPPAASVLDKQHGKFQQVDVPADSSEKLHDGQRNGGEAATALTTRNIGQWREQWEAWSDIYTWCNSLGDEVLRNLVMLILTTFLLWGSSLVGKGPKDGVAEATRAIWKDPWAQLPQVPVHAVVIVLRQVCLLCSAVAWRACWQERQLWLAGNRSTAAYFKSWMVQDRSGFLGPGVDYMLVWWWPDAAKAMMALGYTADMWIGKVLVKLGVGA